MVDGVDVVFESSLSFGSGKIEGESFSVLDGLQLLFADPHAVSFVHEISAIGIGSADTVVHEKFEGSPFWSGGSSGSGSHV